MAAALSAVRAVAIDYYGTLVDSGRPFDQIRDWLIQTYSSLPVDGNAVFLRFSKERARRQCCADYQAGYVLLRESYEATCNRLQLPLYTDAFHQLLVQLFTRPPAFPGAQRTVARLRRRYPVLLLTNADNLFLYESIRRQAFVFDHVLSSEDMQCNKPDPLLFHTACELLGQPPAQVVMVGDSWVEDVLGAQQVGMKAVWRHTASSAQEEDVLRVSSISELESLLLAK